MKKYFRFIIMLAMMLVFALPAFASNQITHGPGYDLLYGLGGMLGVGMVINAANISALFKNFKTVFNEAFSAYQPQWKKIAMEVPSTGAENVYAWLGAFPKMREWLGERQFKNLGTHDWTIKNKKFEATVEVPSEAIEDDQYGVYSPLVTAMGGASAQQPDDLVFNLLNNGFTLKGYDGKTFFATNHESGSNKASGGGSVLDPTSYGNALALIRRQKDSEGNPLFSGTEKLYLVVPPELEGTGKKLLYNDYVSVAGGSQENNIHKGSAELVMTPKLTSATAWFIIIEYNGLKPLIFQNRKNPRFVTHNNPETSDHVFKTDKFVFGVDSRNNAGFGLHQLAFGSVGA